MSRPLEHAIIFRDWMSDADLADYTRGDERFWEDAPPLPEAKPEQFTQPAQTEVSF